jgi:hypothetical protein
VGNHEEDQDRVTFEEAWERAAQGDGEWVDFMDALVDVGDGRRVRLRDLGRDELVRAAALARATAAAGRTAAERERHLHALAPER